MKRAILNMILSSFAYNSFANAITSEHPYIFIPDVLRVSTSNTSSVISKSKTDVKVITIAPCADQNGEENKNSQVAIFNIQANIVEEVSGRKPIRKNRPFRSRRGLAEYHPIFLPLKFVPLKIPP